MKVLRVNGDLFHLPWPCPPLVDEVGMHPFSRQPGIGIYSQHEVANFSACSRSYTVDLGVGFFVDLTRFLVSPQKGLLRVPHLFE